MLRGQPQWHHLGLIFLNTAGKREVESKWQRQTTTRIREKAVKDTTSFADGVPPRRRWNPVRPRGRRGNTRDVVGKASGIGRGGCFEDQRGQASREKQRSCRVAMGDFQENRGPSVLILFDHAPGIADKRAVSGHKGRQLSPRKKERRPEREKRRQPFCAPGAKKQPWWTGTLVKKQ